MYEDNNQQTNIIEQHGENWFLTKFRKNEISFLFFCVVGRWKKVLCNIAFLTSFVSLAFSVFESVFVFIILLSFEFNIFSMQKKKGNKRKKNEHKVKGK